MALRREEHCFATGRHIAESTLLLWPWFFRVVDASSILFYQIGILGQNNASGSCPDNGWVHHCPRTFNWPTNNFTCSSNSLPMSKDLPLDFSDSTDTVSDLPSLQRESNLFWYVVTQPRTVVPSNTAFVRLSDVLTPFSAAHLTTFAFNSSEIIA